MFLPSTSACIAITKTVFTIMKDSKYFLIKSHIKECRLKYGHLHFPLLLHRLFLLFLVAVFAVYTSPLASFFHSWASGRDKTLITGYINMSPFCSVSCDFCFSSAVPTIEQPWSKVWDVKWNSVTQTICTHTKKPFVYYYMANVQQFILYSNKI